MLIRSHCIPIQLFKMRHFHRNMYEYRKDNFFELFFIKMLLMLKNVIRSKNNFNICVIHNPLATKKFSYSSSTRSYIQQIAVTYTEYIILYFSIRNRFLETFQKSNHVGAHMIRQNEFRSDIVQFHTQQLNFDSWSL